MTKNKKITIVSLVIVALLAFLPLFLKKDAEFGGSDDAGSQKIAEISGREYEPWFTPVVEQMIGGELPGEVESLFFCIQTAIGVGVLAFGFGYLTARKKYAPKE